MSIVTDMEPGTRTCVIGPDRLIYRLCRHWLQALFDAITSRLEEKFGHASLGL